MDKMPSRMQPLLVGLVLLLFLTGCWDRKEIEEIQFIVGQALDKGGEQTLEDELDEKGGGYKKRNLITITRQQALPRVMAGGTQGGGGSQMQKPYKNFSQSGDAIFQMNRELLLEDDRVPFTQHLKVMVIGEELARTVNLQQLLNVYFHSTFIRKSIVLLIAKGRASETLEMPKSGEIPAFRLIGIADNQKETTRLLPAMTVGKVSAKMAAESSFLLQSVAAKEGEVKFAGAAVIKGKTKKLIGFLSEEELEGLNWLTGKGKGGVVKALYEEQHQAAIYTIEKMESRIQPRVQGDKISFDVKIKSEGQLIEDWSILGNAFENKYLKKVEKAAQDEVRRLVDQSLKKMQQEYQVDVAGFGDQLRIQYPEVWQKVKKDWDKEFSKARVKYTVKLQIRDYGTEGTKQKQ